MSPGSSPQDVVPSAAELNAQIRALIAGAGRRLTDEEKRELDRLYEQWTAASRTVAA
ncbi:hypothetical protein [Streptomyces sp. 1222.5]|uniref:hypothetical protein n=1 Tax=Streptomyces sp. 1222.5 TaxID=1881026 RepID=UPI003EBCD26D